MPNKNLVIIGLLGPTLDTGRGSERWEKWRPTVSLCQHEELLVSRLELLYQPKFAQLAQTVTADIATVAPETAVRQVEMEFADAWDFEGVYARLHDYARMYEFKPEREDYLIHITTGTHVAQICLFLLTEARYFPARLIQTAPGLRGREAEGRYEIIDLDLSKYDRLVSRFRQERAASMSFLKAGIATRSKAFNKLIERIEEVASKSKAPLLLQGPTGAGKSSLAKRVYELKRSKHQISGAFVEINCATMRGDGAMSALFGHVKGAFTGALKDRPGLLRAADGGVLFLDEIGELGLDEQAMLLRALEEKTFMPLGGDKEVRSDFQLIAGTNRDLSAWVREGRFREDLLARINLWTFHLPGLRDRVEDIEPNLEYELEQFAVRQGTQVTFSRDARARFLKFATEPAARWTGNFRDLNAAITRMATLADSGRITSALVEEECERLTRSWQSETVHGLDANADGLNGLLSARVLADLDLFDRLQLAAVVQVCRQARSLSEAGRQLFAASRDKKRTANDADRLSKYLARFGLSWQAINGQAG